MKIWIRFLVLLIVAFGINYAFNTYAKLELISGFAAKNSASLYYVANHSLQNIEQQDNSIGLIGLSQSIIDNTQKTATASVYGLKTRKAIYRDGLGALLIDDSFNVSKPYLKPKRSNYNYNIAFPYGDAEPLKIKDSTIDYIKLNQTIAKAFDKKTITKLRTRAIVVLYKDQIIAEKYADGLDKNSKLLGWSMTKSITSAMFGVLEKQNRMKVNQKAPIKEWQEDNRKNITINNLLQMNSGLEWEEDYSKICDVTKMLFLEKDMTKSQVLKPAKFKPNTHWLYSSGTTNVLSGIIRQQFKTHQEYLDFWYTNLIDKIGMHSMVLETDMMGNYAGSSYGWATARDWAKFGLLYLHKGNWNGQQIFDPNWVTYTTTPTNTSNGQYGAQFWLNTSGTLPNVPRNVFYADGYQGQRIFIVPSHDLVVVRLGLDQMDFNAFLSEIIGSIKK